MIADVLNFLKDRLNKAVPRDSSGHPAEDLFVYAGTAREDAVSFKSDSVSILLVRIEEETLLRPPDLYARTSAAGARQKVDPEIRMNLYVMFVARFPDDYSQSLRFLSSVIGYFQSNRVFNQENSPELKDGIAHLSLELNTPTFSEQNEIWGSLRAAYQPCAMYKVRMVVFRDEAGEALPALKQPPIIRPIAQKVPQTVPPDALPRG
jgi:hypothetical protein